MPTWGLHRPRERGQGRGQPPQAWGKEPLAGTAPARLSREQVRGSVKPQAKRATSAVTQPRHSQHPPRAQHHGHAPWALAPCAFPAECPTGPAALSLQMGRLSYRNVKCGLWLEPQDLRPAPPRPRCAFQALAPAQSAHPKVGNSERGWRQGLGVVRPDCGGRCRRSGGYSVQHSVQGWGSGGPTSVGGGAGSGGRPGHGPPGEQASSLTLVTRGLLLDHGQRGAGGWLAQGVASAFLDFHLQFGKCRRCLKRRTRSIWGGHGSDTQSRARPPRAEGTAWLPQQAGVPSRGIKAPGRAGRELPWFLWDAPRGLVQASRAVVGAPGRWEPQGPPRTPSYLHLAGSAILLGTCQLHGGRLFLPGGAPLGKVLKGLLAGHAALVTQRAGPRHHIQHGDDGAWLHLWLLARCLGGHDVERRWGGVLLGWRGARGQRWGLQQGWQPGCLLGGELGGWGRRQLGQEGVVGVQGTIALFLPVALGLGWPQLAPSVFCGERGKDRSVPRPAATHPPASPPEKSHIVVRTPAKRGGGGGLLQMSSRSGTDARQYPGFVDFYT